MEPSSYGDANRSPSEAGETGRDPRPCTDAVGLSPGLGAGEYDGEYGPGLESGPGTGARDGVGERAEGWLCALRMSTSRFRSADSVEWKSRCTGREKLTVLLVATRDGTRPPFDGPGTFCSCSHGRGAGDTSGATETTTVGRSGTSGGSYTEGGSTTPDERQVSRYLFVIDSASSPDERDSWASAGSRYVLELEGLEGIVIWDRASQEKVRMLAPSTMYDVAVAVLSRN